MKIIGMIDTHSGESILLIPPQCLVVLLNEIENCTKYTSRFHTVCKKYCYLKYWPSIYLALDLYQILQYRLHLVQTCYFFFFLQECTKQYRQIKS